MKTYGLPRLALLIVILSCLFYTSNSVALAQEATPTFTPPPAATPKTTATEPAPPTVPPLATATATNSPPTATYTPPAAATDTPTPVETPTPGDTPTHMPTALPPTATSTSVPTDVVFSLGIDAEEHTTEGDRFLVTIFTNREATCDINVYVATDDDVLPSGLQVTIPSGERGVSFYLVAINNDSPDGSRTFTLAIEVVTGGCEQIAVGKSSDTILVYDPSTGIPTDNEPGQPHRINLPLIVMGIALDGRGLIAGFVLIISLAFVYMRRPKKRG